MGKACSLVSIPLRTISGLYVSLTHDDRRYRPRHFHYLCNDLLFHHCFQRGKFSFTQPGTYQGKQEPNLEDVEASAAKSKERHQERTPTYSSQKDINPRKYETRTIKEVE